MTLSQGYQMVQAAIPKQSHIDYSYLGIIYKESKDVQNETQHYRL